MTDPVAPTMSPRSTSSSSAIGVVQRGPASQNSWMSPVRSRSDEEGELAHAGARARRGRRRVTRVVRSCLAGRGRRRLGRGCSAACAVTSKRERERLDAARAEALEGVAPRAGLGLAAAPRVVVGGLVGVAVVSHRPAPTFLSKTSRRPSSVSHGSWWSIVLAVRDDRRGARPPVATTVALPPSSLRMRSTIPSTSPAVPKIRPDWIASTVFLPIGDLRRVQLDLREPRRLREQRSRSRSARRARSRRRGTRPASETTSKFVRGAEVDDDAGSAEPA